MLIHYLRGRTLERCLAGHHLPERHTERIEIRTDVYAGLRRTARDWQTPVSRQSSQGVEIAV